MRKRLAFGVLVAVLCVGHTFLGCALAPYPPPTITANVVKVVDGDTVDVKVIAVDGTAPVDAGQEVRVRYIGINTPETVHPSKAVEYFGEEASTFNASLVADKTVYLELDIELYDHDRLLAYVYLDSQGYAMVNAILVAMGFANVATYPPNVRYREVFQGLERTARGLGLGLWAISESNESPETETSSDEKGCFEWRGFHYDAAGNDNQNKNDEYFTLKNTCDHAINMTGWTVSDAANHVFAFPPGFTLAPNAQVTIYTGSGLNTSDKLYWGAGGAIWNNTGDTATLQNAAGEMIKSYSY